MKSRFHGYAESRLSEYLGMNSNSCLSIIGVNFCTKVVLDENIETNLTRNDLNNDVNKSNPPSEKLIECAMTVCKLLLQLDQLPFP